MNLNWIIKLKTNKTSIKGIRKKIRNKKKWTKLKKIIYDKLRLKDEIENK
jgi:hypothetical protein